MISEHLEKNTFDKTQDSNSEQLNSTLGQVKALKTDREQLLNNLKQFEETNLQIRTQV